MWGVDPSAMCRNHLLGEHVEMHMFVEYKRIYQNAKKYGVGMHQIDDLCFEGFTLHRNGKLDLWIGS